MTGNDHDFEDADPLELAEIKRRWETPISTNCRICVPLRRTATAAASNSTRLSVRSMKVLLALFFVAFL